MHAAIMDHDCIAQTLLNRGAVRYVAATAGFSGGLL